ncbi:MAG TPA: SAM-dependent methyltransferase [Micromonosporaceae bacterium]|nr:SAM-dependent methyltransferase [Micromonosporaceae bacterium]
MARPDWVAEDIDLNTPSVARAYDYLLGGAHNFAADREYARELLAMLPDFREIALANRAFLHRAVRFMVKAGIRQFLDIGSGVPTVGNVHEIAQKLDPKARVVYVDIDPVAVMHSRQILANNDLATVVQEDLRRPEAILDHQQTRALLDLDQPVGLILVAVLPAVPDQDDPYGLMARLRDALAPGSYVAISHGTADKRGDEIRAAVSATRRTTTPVTVRTRDEVLRFFAGLELVEPGVVWSAQWRPDSPEDVGDRPERLMMYAGVGRKP